MNIRKIIKEEINDFDWIKDTQCPVKRGDMFHVENRPPGPQTVIWEVSDDCEWVRRVTIEEWDNIKKGRMHTWMKKKYDYWDSKPFNGSNAMKISQVVKNIGSGFWTKVDPLNESEDFDWIKQDITLKKIPYKPNRGGHYNLLIDHFNNNPRINYKGWSLSMDAHAGSISWEHPDLPQTIYYATPYFEGFDSVPIDYSYWGNEGDEYKHVGDLKIPKFEYEWELTDWLDGEYLKKVHEKIMEFNGPIPE